MKYFSASRYGHLPVVEFLYSYLEDPDEPNPNGDTCFQLAAKFGHTDIENFFKPFTQTTITVDDEIEFNLKGSQDLSPLAVDTSFTNDMETEEISEEPSKEPSDQTMEAKKREMKWQIFNDQEYCCSLGWDPKPRGI